MVHHSHFLCPLYNHVEAFCVTLWINASIFIFLLVHIPNLPTLIVLTPPHLPCTPFVDHGHLWTNHVNSIVDYGNTPTNSIDFFIDYANKFNDRVNTLDD
jgi:hypothetical protein